MERWWEDAGTVQNNILIDLDVYRLVIHAPMFAEHALPGQFLMLLGWTDPLLARAMAPIHYDKRTGAVEIIYRVVGPGTQAMTRLRPGEVLTIIGPLGSPFKTLAQTMAVIGRGVGITPLLPIAELSHGQGSTIRAYLSARSPTLLLNESSFSALGSVFTQNDCIQRGERITDLFDVHLQEGFRPDTVVVAGSHRLALAAHHLSRIYGFSLWVFVEEKMACGVGYCKGCAIGPQQSMICVNGPALPSHMVLAHD